MVQIFLAWVYGHILEYCLHKHVLHNKKIKVSFRHHFRNHHKIARKNGFFDDRYEKFFSKNSFFEVGTLLLLAILHLPLVAFYPAAYFTLLWSVVMYYIFHRKMHLDPGWARKWTPWHFEHHMGKDQHDWWGVRLPIVDLAVKLITMSWNKLIKRHN
jgi:hypothetical protein